MNKTNNADPKNLLDLDGSLKRLNGDEELFKEFVVIFFEDTPGMMKGIEDGLNASDASAVQRHSHAIKGMLSNFGAQDCVDISSRLERAGRNGSLADSPKDFEKLQRLYETLCDELKPHV